MREHANLVRDVAYEIVNQTIFENYRFYLLVVAISLVASAVGAFLVAYFKKRGESLATKADFAEMLRQLKDTTSLAEGIKSDLKAKHDEDHKLRNLTREKMEALFEQTFELDVWFERTRSIAVDGTCPNFQDSPIWKIEMYQSIYFKEVRNEVNELSIAAIAMNQWILSLTKTGSNANARSPKQNVDLEKFAEHQRAVNDALSILRERLLDKYASKLGL